MNIVVMLDLFFSLLVISRYRVLQSRFKAVSELTKTATRFPPFGHRDRNLLTSPSSLVVSLCPHPAHHQLTIRAGLAGVSSKRWFLNSARAAFRGFARRRELCCCSACPLRRYHYPRRRRSTPQLQDSPIHCRRNREPTAVPNSVNPNLSK